MRRTPLPGVIATCVVASCGYAGVVTLRALVTLVLPAVVVTAGVAAAAARRPLVGLLTVAGTSLAAAEAVNVLSGDFQGPAARATAAGAFLAGTAVVLAVGRFGATFLLAVAGIVGSAMVLGAGGQVRTIALATAAAATLSLLEVERRRTRVEGPGGAGVAAALAVALVLAGSAVGLIVHAETNSRPARIPFPQLAHNQPPPVPGFLAVRRPGSTTVPAGSPAGTASRAHDGDVTRLFLPGVAVVVLALVLMALGRLVWARLSWLLLRRRCGRGVPRDRVSGAWVFTSARLAALDQGLALRSSPDVVARSGSDPHLRDLATLVEQTVFAAAGDPSAGAASDAWAQADRALRVARRRTDPWARVQGAWRIAPLRRRTA